MNGWFPCIVLNGIHRGKSCEMSGRWERRKEIHGLNAWIKVRFSNGTTAEIRLKNLREQTPMEKVLLK